MGSPETETGRRNNEDPQHPVTIGKPFAVSSFMARFVRPRRAEAGRGADVSRGPGKGQRATGA